ncbi:MAG: SPOR domain-containing protein [Alphaproteobacteria bacterium]|nr:SPOR domain-containing protein [Alphaproteobacteria bacterium]
MNDDNNLDLLDLDDADTLDTLPEAPAFVAPRPKKPWLLLTLGIAIIVLASYIIIRSIGGESSSSIEVDLDAPVAVVDGAGAPVDMNVMPPVKPVEVAPKPAPVEQPKTQPAPVAQPESSMPVRVVEDRKEVKFDPAKAVAPKPVAKPAAKPAAKPQPKPAAKPKQTASVYSWYVQLGSYSTRALAEAAQTKLRNAHPSLFSGQQFVVLAAQLKNGTTTYRLRVGFNTSSDANGFCRNAKADGLDCYVTK